MRSVQLACVAAHSHANPTGYESLVGTLGGEVMSSTWKLRKGKVLVVEDAETASLVVVARDLKDRDDKIAALEEVLRKLRA
jgi:hypothetical protein